MTTLTPSEHLDLDPDLQNLIEQAKQRGPMTPAELQEQRISFAYGMLSDENPLTKEDVRQLDYAKYGNLQRTTEQTAALSKLEAGTHVLVNISKFRFPLARELEKWTDAPMSADIVHEAFDRALLQAQEDG